MKAIAVIFFTFFLTTVYGQTDDYKVLLDSAKTLFKHEESLYNLGQKEPGKSNYYQIVFLLERVIELNPDNSEARYFLGYTYSRINSEDGRDMVDMNLDLLYKTSEQFENVIKLTPKYTDEIIILDPYSKLTAEWGSMAMGYWYNNKVDSAIWAFREGKNRGGFGNFILEYNKKVLDACSEKAILISSGDNTIFPLLYWQIAENYRTDATVIDINLLHTDWYPAFLSKNKLVLFDLPDEILDTIQHTKWADTTITINDFSWTVKPSYYNQYLLRGDRVFLSLLKENKFERDIFFASGFPEDSKLSLENYLTSFIIVDKLITSKKQIQTYEDYKGSITHFLQLSEHLNLNSSDELKIYDIFRYNILMHITNHSNDNEEKEVKELLDILDKYGNSKKYPYENPKVEEYENYLRQIFQETTPTYKNETKKRRNGKQR